jgi:hypothetical protein
MAIVNQVQKKVRMDIWECVKIQFLVHCFIKNIKISDLDLSCLSMLAIQGETDLTDFCNTAADNNIFGCSQSVRNAVAKAERKGLIEFAKIGKSRKKIKISKEIVIQTTGNILLDYKFIRIEPEKSEGAQ